MRLFVSTILILIGLSVFSQQVSEEYFKGLKSAEEGNYERAEPLIAQHIGQEMSALEKGKGYFYLMRIYWSQDQFDKSLTYGDSAIATFESIDDHYWKGETLYRLCMNNLIAGSYDIALTQSQESFEEFTLAEDTFKMIWSLGRRGIVFHDITEYEEGLRVMQQTDELHQLYSGKHADLQAMIWGISAINFDDWDKPAEAVKLYRKILKLEPELSSDRELVRTYNNMGNSLMKLGQLDEAEKNFLLNLEANEKEGFRYGIATVKTNLGTIAYRKGDYTRARKLLNEAEAISYEINDVEKILDILQQQQLYHEAVQKPAIALTYLKKYNHLKDSLYSLDKQRQIRLLEKQYESEKKEQQIKIQEAQISAQEAVLSRNQIALAAVTVALILLITIGWLYRNRLKKAQELALEKEKLKTQTVAMNASISSQEKERARYARDLHDGFGQLISTLKIHLGKLRKDDAIQKRDQVFEGASEVIDAMYKELREICFDLMPNTLVKQGIIAGLEELCNRINTSGAVDVDFHAFGLDKRLSEVQEISIYRISQEWINNVLKYAGAKKITLQLTADELELTLTIEDDGQGFNKDLLKKSKGNGWKNLNTRSKLIEGILELETDPNRSGTTLILNAPLTLKTAVTSDIEENTINMV